MFFPVIAAALFACAGDATAPDSLYATYSLRTANDKALPAVLLVEGDYAFAVQSGSYSLRENGTFSSAVTFHEEYRGWTHSSTHTFDGTFSIAADTVTFLWPGKNESWRGTLVGRRLTVVARGISYVYER